MSDPSAFGFGQFVPGFDFLQNLSKTASQAQTTAAPGMPGMASWVAPTLSIEDIDKRIQELKSVLFWLEQNTTALKATIQAMEVQKMTLTTLQGMNVNMADLAKAFTAKPPVAEPAAPEAGPEPKSSLFTPKPAPEANTPKTDTAQAAETPSDKPAVDPMQWWGALTQQFQGIAAAALKDVAGEAMKTGMTAKNAVSQKTKPARTSAAKPKATPSAAAKSKRPQAKAATTKIAPAKQRQSS
ncbi:MAG: hypothetical protein FJY28_01695 [Betaproteobacteria bacterium]|nr:hypothetical protein [Betaproteobacteria bacterium]